MISQGTQTAETLFKHERGLASLATASSSTHFRSKRRHGQGDVYPEGANVANAKDGEEGSLMRKDKQSTRSVPLCRECEQPVTMKSGKRRADRLPTPEPDEHPVGQSSQDAKEQPKKKRNIRVIPGRFSALDSSDEEEDQREFDRKQVNINMRNVGTLFSYAFSRWKAQRK